MRFGVHVTLQFCVTVCANGRTARLRVYFPFRVRAERLLNYMLINSRNLF